MAIQTVLLALGPADERRADALAEAAIELAAPTGATVVLGHVFEDDQFHSLRALLAESGDDVIESVGGSLTTSATAAPEADLTADEVASRIVVVRDVADRLGDADVGYVIRGAVETDLAEAILQLADEVDADRLLVGGRRRSPAGKAVFGSTAQTVLLNAPCPVEFVRVD